jgi:hypothetical protein
MMLTHLGPSGLTPSLPLRVLTSLPRPDGRAIAWRRFAPKLPGRYPDASGPSPYLSQRERRKSLPVLTPLLFREGYSNLPLRCYTSTLCSAYFGNCETNEWAKMIT